LAKQKSPAFPFYASDFLSDLNVIVLTADEVGAYILLMAVCWRETFLPDSLDELAAIARLQPGQFKTSWERRLSRCFAQRDDGSWVHPRLEKERAKQEANAAERSKYGKLGAKVRYGGAIANPSPGHGEALAKSSLSISNSISISSNKEKLNKKKTATPVPADFPVTDKMQEFALKLGVETFEAETEHFLDHHRARGTLFKDWVAGWRTWIRNSKKFGRPNGTPRKSESDKIRRNLQNLSDFAKGGERANFYEGDGSPGFPPPESGSEPGKDPGLV